jgi:hypothetical protein
VLSDPSVEVGELACSDSSDEGLPFLRRVANHAARAAIVLIAAVLVIFWRLVLRVLLAIIAIAVMVLVGSGAIVLLQSMHR